MQTSMTYVISILIIIIMINLEKPILELLSPSSVLLNPSLLFLHNNSDLIGGNCNYEVSNKITGCEKNFELINLICLPS